MSEKALGIDIGGTKIAVATVLGGGEIVREVAVPTESERGFADGVARITEAASRVLDESAWTPSELLGIGIACAGPVDSVRGTIENPHTLPGWTGGNIVAALGEAFACPVILENDADMALLGECYAGAGRGFDPVVMLTFGTGIGGAVRVGGTILRGLGGEHPEMGHVPVDPAGPRCYCGANGCFEILASGSALAAAARDLGLGDARQLLARAAEGQPSALGVRSRALAATAIAAWTILHTVLPQRLILGGGMMDEHYELFAAAVRAATSKATLVPAARVSVARAELGNRAGLVGAARAVWSRPLPKAADPVPSEMSLRAEGGP